MNHVSLLIERDIKSFDLVWIVGFDKIGMTLRLLELTEVVNNMQNV
jgi:hypothetical protein